MQLFKSNTSGKTMDLLEQVSLSSTSKKVLLRITAEGDHYNFHYAEKPNNWVLLKDKVDAKFLSTHEAGGFIGCIFGMYATSSGMKTTNNASFKYLFYRGDDPMYKVFQKQPALAR